MQWFEHAHFEYHPEYAGTAYVVLLGQLGREALAARPAVRSMSSTVHTLASAIVPLLAVDGAAERLTRPDADTSLVRDPALLPATPSGTMPVRTVRVGAWSRSTSDIGGPQRLRLATLPQAGIGAALAERGYTPPYSRVGADGGSGKTYGHLATCGNVHDPTG